MLDDPAQRELEFLRARLQLYGKLLSGQGRSSPNYNGIRITLVFTLVPLAVIMTFFSGLFGAMFLEEHLGVGFAFVGGPIIWGGLGRLWFVLLRDIMPDA